MRFVLTIFAVLVLAGGCAGTDSPQAANDDPAGTVYGNSYVGAPPILVPGRGVTVN